jgi:hypothetical protein
MPEEITRYLGLSENSVKNVIFMFKQIYHSLGLMSAVGFPNRLYRITNM